MGLCSSLSRTPQWLISSGMFYTDDVFFCFFFVFFQGQPTNSMGSELTSDNSKLHGHTNEHVQFEGAHQEKNRSLLPCRHTDNDKCIGILGMHPCFY